LLAQSLIAQQEHEVLVPDVLDLREDGFVGLPAQVDAGDLRAQCRRQRPYPERRRTKPRLRASTFHLPAPWMLTAAVGDPLGMIMGRESVDAQGSFASMRMNAMRQGAVPRLTQA